MSFFRGEREPLYSQQLADTLREPLESIPSDVPIGALLRFSEASRLRSYAQEPSGLSMWQHTFDHCEPEERQVINRALAVLARAIPINDDTGPLTLGKLKTMSPEELRQQYQQLEGLGYDSIDFLIEIGLLRPTHRDS